MHKNGTTTAGTPRWRCPNCNASQTGTRANTANIQHFKVFLDWVLTGEPAERIAHRLHVTRRTLTRWFTFFWFIVVPSHTDKFRVYDQLFIDGTYFHNKCLLVACTAEHPVAWLWCTGESKYNYARLLDMLAPPLIVTIDGSGGARAVIKKHWPDTKIQRCLVHVQRNILTDISRHPRYPAHKALRTFAYQLTHIETPDEAREFITRVHKASVTFGPWLKEKTYRSQVQAADIPRWVKPSQKFWFTHRGARRSFNRLNKLINDGTLFTYLNPPEGVTCDVKSTTNLLEGGINKQLKDLAGAHRGTFDEHQRIIMDWWLYIRTENPVPPLQLALEQDFGRKGEEKAQAAWAEEEIKRRGHADGRPATYDTGIDSEWNPSLGVRKGWAGRG